MSGRERYFYGGVSTARLQLFSTAFLALLAVDLWTHMLLRAYRYGADGFNVAHFGWLDAIQPEPSSASYSALLLLCGLLALWMALTSVRRMPAVALCVLFAYGWMQSLLDAFQHHYFLSLILFCLVFFPREEADSDATGVAPGFGYALLGITVAVLYVFTAIAKMDAPWLMGDTLERINGARNHLGPVRDFALGLGLGEGTFWSVLATQVIPLELGLGVAYLFAVAFRDRPERPVRAACWLAWGLAMSLHVGVEVMGLRIGFFSYYMMLLAFVFFMPTNAVAAANRALRWPMRALLARVAPLANGSGRVFGMAALAAVVLCLGGVLVDLPGGIAAGAMASCVLLGSAVLAISRGALASAREASVAAGIATASMLLVLSLTPTRYEFYASLGHWRMLSADLPGAARAFDDAERHAPASAHYRDQLDGLRDLLRDIERTSPGA